MTEELKEQIHERVYNIKVPTLGFSRRDLFDIAMEYAEPREIQLQEKDKKIQELEEQIKKMKSELHHRLVSPSHDDSDCLDKIVGLDRLWQFGQEF